MPEQTIVINYKFNTAEVEKANALLQKTNESSNKLQQSAASGASNIQKEFNKSNKTIADMQAGLTRLKSMIEITSNPQKLAQLSGEYKTMKKNLDDAVKSTMSLGKAATNSAGGVNSMVLQFKELSRWAGLGVISMITKEVVDMGLSLATLQGQVDGVERGFNRAFTNPIEILNEVRDATHGTITDFDLMKRSLQATNLGVSVEHLGTLFEFAAARAQQTGESVDYLVDSIVRGIGRKSPLVLDNLGISVTALKEKFDGASIASKTVAEATEGVAEIAKEQLEKMGGYVETAETTVKQLTVAWETLRIEMAKKIDSSGIVTFFTNAANGLAALIKGGSIVETEAKQAASKRLAALLDDEIFKDRKKNQLQQIDLIMQEIVETKELIRTKQTEIEQFEAAKTAAEKRIAVDEFGNVIQQQSVTFREKAIDSIKKQKIEYEELLSLLAKTLRSMQAEMELEGTHIETLDEMRKRLEGLIEAWDNWVTTQNSNSDEAKKRIKEIKDLRHEIKKLEALLEDPKEFSFKMKKGKLPKSGVDTGPLEKLTLKDLDIVKPMSDEEIDAWIKRNLTGPTFGTHLKRAFKRMAVGEIEEGWEEGIMMLELGGIQILGDQLMSLADVQQASFDKRIRDTRAFYDEQLTLAGNNEKAKDLLRIREDKKIAELRKKQFIAEQKAAKQKAVINGATAIIKTFAELGFTPVAIAASILLAAEIASQIAIIDRQQPKFAKGKIDIQGPGTSTSDSIHARLSKHETVMPAWATKNSRGIFQDIMARKLDDRILRNLKDSRHTVVTPGFNDSNLIKAIRDNRPPDLILQNGIVYEGRQKSAEYINKVRAKSVKL